MLKQTYFYMIQMIKVLRNILYKHIGNAGSSTRIDERKQPRTLKLIVKIKLFRCF